MGEIIRRIISEIPSNCYFDAHVKIFKLIEENSDIYLREFSADSTALFHGRLGNVKQF